MREQNYGSVEGLPDRLEALADRTATDKSTPWLGLGPYRDLKLAVALLRANPTMAQPPKPELEFDL